MKISKEQLKIYQSYSGDCDGFSRTANTHSKEIMKNFPWSHVDELLQALQMIKNYQATYAFESQTISAVQKICDSTETEDYFRTFL